MPSIAYTLTNATMFDGATHQDADKWAAHVAQRLKTEFRGYDIVVLVDCRQQSDVMYVNAVDHEVTHETVSRFIGSLWDTGLETVFPN